MAYTTAMSNEFTVKYRVNNARKGMEGTFCLGFFELIMDERTSEDGMGVSE